MADAHVEVHKGAIVDGTCLPSSSLFVPRDTLAHDTAPNPWMSRG